MAKDDYDYLVFRILVYLYACLKRKCGYDSRTLARKVAGGGVQEDYFEDALRMMQEEGLVSGLQFTQAWGREYLLVDGLEQLRITPAGIRYTQQHGLRLFSNGGGIENLLGRYNNRKIRGFRNNRLRRIG